jgi:hypothetical protein
MTVCKTFKRIQLEKEKAYKRNELIEDLGRGEQLASTYFDPPRDELYSFFNEKSDDWDNQFDKNTRIFKFKHKTEKTLARAPAWECTKVRHVFLHHENMEASTFEYLGTSIDETIVQTSSHDERHLYII